MVLSNRATGHGYRSANLKGTGVTYRSAKGTVTGVTSQCQSVPRPSHVPARRQAIRPAPGSRTKVSAPGLAGALGGADQRPAPRAPGQNQRPAPRAPERPRSRPRLTIPS